MSTSQNIKALLFDFGGVVVEIDFERALETWKQWSMLSIEDMRLRFKFDNAYEKHERGEIDASEYFAYLRSVLELEASDSEIALGWNAIFLGEIEETIELIQTVKHRLACFAFSNSNPTHQATWLSKYPGVVESFHQIFVSSELGLRKPESEAFQAISDATGIRLDEMLFFDDTEENVRGAKAVGMNAVHVRRPLDVKQSLADIGAL